MKVSFPLSELFSSALNVLKILSAYGDTYIVGGSVRDLILNIPVSDIDFATNVPMEKIESLFETHDIGQNKDFGIVVIKFNGFIFEIAQFRTENKYSDSRHPDSVNIVSSFEEDSKRRDFTINALAVDQYGEVIDYHGGIEDIYNKVLRTVNNPINRFGEDALRILRAIRFASILDFKLDPDTLKAMYYLRSSILELSYERIYKEINKIAIAGKFNKAIDLLQETQLFNILYPNAKNEDLNFSLNNYASIFAILHLELSEKEVTELAKKHKFCNNEIKQIKYIVREFKNYHNIFSLNRKKALSLLNDENSNHLRDVYIVVYGKDSLTAIEREFILSFNKVLNKIPNINAILLKYELKGKIFGKWQNRIIDWLFLEFENGNLYDNFEIEEFLQKELANEIQKVII